MNNAVFWEVITHGSCNNRRFGESYRFHHQGEKTQRARNNVSSNYQLKHSAIRSSEMSVLKEHQGVTSQNTAFFIVTAVKTSNLT
jgi:hypothetical protein